MVKPIILKGIKFVIENNLIRKGWNPLREKYVASYCCRCGCQRHHKLVSVINVNIPGKTVRVLGFKCSYCANGGLWD
jgi:hypothetical protein